MAFIKEMTAPASMPKALKRTNALPLDSSAVWYSLDELETYAKEGATAYVGQIVSLVDKEANTSVAYMISNTAGDLVQVGAVKDEGAVVNPTIGDDATIVVENDVAKLYGFGQAYYRWDAESAVYVRQEVTEEYPWKEGLEPRVVLYNEEYVLGWFEASPEIENEIADVAASVEALEDKLNAELEDSTDAESGEKVLGLKSRVTNLETDVVNLEQAVANTYTKEEVNERVAGLFHFKDAVEELPESAEEGDVYQVGDKEWVWNGEDWVELGFTVDLTNYATKAHVTEQLANYATKTYVTEQLTPVSDQVAANKTALETLTAVDGTIAQLQQNVQNNTSGLSAVDGRLTTLENTVGTASTDTVAGTGLIGRVETLEETIERVTSSSTGEINVIEKVFADTTELKVNSENKSVTIPVYDGALAGLVPVMNSTLVAENKTNADYVLNGAGQWKLMEDIRINNLTIDGTTYSTVEEYIAKYVELNAGANIYWEAIETTQA